MEQLECGVRGCWSTLVSTTTELSTTTASTEAEEFVENFTSVQTKVVDIIITIVLIIELFIFLALVLLIKSEKIKAAGSHTSFWLRGFHDSKKRTDSTSEKQVQWKDESDLCRTNVIHENYMTFENETQMASTSRNLMN